MTAPNLPPDPATLIATKEYRSVLLTTAVLGVIVSAASWAFLELVYVMQRGVYEHLPNALGYEEIPWWWPVPPLVIAGALVGFAIDRLPGRGGHIRTRG